MTIRDEEFKEIIHETMKDICSYLVNSKYEESYYVTESLKKLVRWVEVNPSSNMWTQINTPDDLPEEGKIVLGITLTLDSNNQLVYKHMLCQRKYSEKFDYRGWYSLEGEPLQQMNAWMQIPEYNPMPDYIDERYHRPEPL